METRPLVSLRQIIVLTACLLGGSSCVPRAEAQVVFLPTWHVFSANGSWLVPDRGRMGMGAVGRRHSATTQRGIPGLPDWIGGSSSGRDLAHAGTSVHVTIIDHAAWDRAVHERFSASLSGNVTSLGDRRQIQSLNAETKPSPHDVAGSMSLSEIRRLRARRQTADAAGKPLPSAPGVRPGQPAYRSPK